MRFPEVRAYSSRRFSQDFEFALNRQSRDFRVSVVTQEHISTRDCVPL
jgi:hypothetical protein